MGSRVCSENCKETHQVSLPSSDVADTSVVFSPPHYSKSVQKILQDLETVEIYRQLWVWNILSYFVQTASLTSPLGTEQLSSGLVWPGLSSPSVCFKSLKVSDCKCRIISYQCAIIAVWGITGRLDWLLFICPEDRCDCDMLGCWGPGGMSYTAIQLWCYNSIWGCSFLASQLLQLLSAFIFIKLLTNYRIK